MLSIDRWSSKITTLPPPEMILAGASTHICTLKVNNPLCTSSTKLETSSPSPLIFNLTHLRWFLNSISSSIWIQPPQKFPISRITFWDQSWRGMPTTLIHTWFNLSAVAVEVGDHHSRENLWDFQNHSPLIVWSVSILLGNSKRNLLWPSSLCCCRDNVSMSSQPTNEHPTEWHRGSPPADFRPHFF